jgi:hypothetical protein
VFIEPLPSSGLFRLAPLFWLSSVMSQYSECSQVLANDSNK